MEIKNENKNNRKVIFKIISVMTIALIFVYLWEIIYQLYVLSLVRKNKIPFPLTSKTYQYFKFERQNLEKLKTPAFYFLKFLLIRIFLTGMGIGGRIFFYMIILE